MIGCRDIWRRRARRFAPATSRDGLGDALSRQATSDAAAQGASASASASGTACITSTGRAGLTLLLRALRALCAPAPRRGDPAVVHLLLGAGVGRQGRSAAAHRRRLAATRWTTRPRRSSSADFSRVLAIVATNLYGLPNDLPALDASLARHGAFLIDDAAQAHGRVRRRALVGHVGRRRPLQLRQGQERLGDRRRHPGHATRTRSRRPCATRQLARSCRRRLAGRRPCDVAEGARVLRATAAVALLASRRESRSSGWAQTVYHDGLSAGAVRAASSWRSA